jgi:hypothetical protein
LSVTDYDGWENLWLIIALVNSCGRRQAGKEESRLKAVATPLYPGPLHSCPWLTSYCWQVFHVDDVGKGQELLMVLAYW